jgi:2-phospho-L-lactate guanylyltransferase
MKPWVVVPAKCFWRGKSRLAPVLDSRGRARFSRALFDRALAVVRASPLVGGVLVATDCAEVAARARSRGAQAMLSAAPLRQSVDAALDALAAAGADRALVLMSDLPRVEPADVTALARLLDGHELVIAPDALDAGTNALGLRLTSARRTHFGHEDSFARHLDCARRARLSAAEYRDARVGFDVDWPRDLARL